MRENRIVNFSTKIGLIKQKPIQALFGFLFTLMPMLIIIPLGIVFSSLDSDIPEANYDEVNQNGTLVVGTVDDIEVQYNTQINGQHPAILSYSFEFDGQTKFSKVKTLEPTKVEQLNVGDSVDIKTLNNQSIIVGFRPYSFPIGFIFFFPIPFLIIGLPFLISLLFGVSKEVKLYKEGQLIDGEILAMTPNSGLPITNIGQSVNVHYQYNDSKGKRQIGKSKTTDFSILSDKKKGETIKVLVLPTNEAKSCLYPELAAIKNQWND